MRRTKLTRVPTVRPFMGEKRYVCDACGEEFESETELRKHLDNVGMVE